MFVLLCVCGSANAEKSLAEIYQTGKVRFVKEFEITDESLPEGEFFSNILAVTMDEEGAIYACDYQANNIKKFEYPDTVFCKSLLGCVSRWECYHRIFRKV